MQPADYRRAPKPNPKPNQGGDGAPGDRPTRASVDLSLRACCAAPDHRAHARAAAAHDSGVERGPSRRWPLGVATPRSPRRDLPAFSPAWLGGTCLPAWLGQPSQRHAEVICMWPQPPPSTVAAPATYGCSPRHLRLQPLPPTVAGKHHAKDEIAMWTVAVPKQQELSGLTPYAKAMSVQVGSHRPPTHTRRAAAFDTHWTAGQQPLAHTRLRPFTRLGLQQGCSL